VSIDHVEPCFVKSFPSSLEPGLLYVSTHFSTAAHSCACGCEREVITPLSTAQWVLTFDGSVSLWPSIGNWALPCQSHYIIDHGAIRWSRRFNADEIRSNQADDVRALQAARPPKQRSWWRDLVRLLRISARPEHRSLGPRLSSGVKGTGEGADT
jgi:hypothetical protein